MFRFELHLRRVGRLTRVVLLSAAVASGLACTDGGIGALIAGDLDFNEMLRPDLAPLSDKNLADDQRTFSDGAGQTLISELLPLEMTPSELQRLRRADTF